MTCIKSLIDMDDVDVLMLHSRFSPLKRILSYDVFDRGFCGWMTLMPNFTEGPDFDTPPSIVNKDQWPPVMLSSATYRFPGTHGSMSGTYSLKLSTRPVAAPYSCPPAPGSMGHAIKRMSFWLPERQYLQIEAWFAYTAEMDVVDGKGPQPGLHETSVRAFGAGFDVQERGNRYFTGIRYLNSVDGNLLRKWQYVSAAEVSDREWAFGTDGDWCRRGVDPWWFGRRYPDGRHDGYKDVSGGTQNLCYNETDDKINWQYMRMKIDTLNREYVEMQCQDKVFDMRGIPITYVDAYGRIDGLINPVFWVESDADRRVFLYVDSVVVSQE